MGRFICLDGISATCQAKGVVKDRLYSDVEDQCPHVLLALGYIPILDGDLRDLEARVCPLRQQPLIHLFNAAGVSVDGFLLQVPNEPVAYPWGDKVRDEHGVVEDALGGKHHEAHQPAWLVHI